MNISSGGGTSPSASSGALGEKKNESSSVSVSSGSDSPSTSAVSAGNPGKGLATVLGSKSGEGDKAEFRLNLSANPDGGVKRDPNVRIGLDKTPENETIVTQSLTVESAPPAPPAPDTSGFIIPLPGAVTEDFGPRAQHIPGASDFHNGVDFDGETGDPIVASANGTVIQVGNNGTYGITVTLDHGNGMTTLYAHMNGLPPLQVGQTVTQGEQIGQVGLTGLTTGSHLHFELRQNGAGIDPMPFFKG